MNNIQLIVDHLNYKLDQAKRQFNENPSEGVKIVLATSISCYQNLLHYINDMTVDKDCTVDTSLPTLNGWISKSEKDNQVWLHYCEGEPEQINGEWFGNEFDTPIDSKLFPLLDSSAPKKVDIILKRK